MFHTGPWILTEWSAKLLELGQTVPFTYVLWQLFLSCYVFSFGAVLGSFLNVVICRLPLGQSIVPGSACPHCKCRIHGYDNIPILSWIWLRGRCRQCSTPISARYPLVELTAGVFVLGLVGITGQGSSVVDPRWFVVASHGTLILTLLAQFIMMLDGRQTPRVPFAPHLLFTPCLLLSLLVPLLVSGVRPPALMLLPGDGSGYQLLSTGIGVSVGLVASWLIQPALQPRFRELEVSVWMHVACGAVLGWQAVVVIGFLGSASHALQTTFVGVRRSIPRSGFTLLAATYWALAGGAIASWYPSLGPKMGAAELCTLLLISTAFSWVGRIVPAQGFAGVPSDQDSVSPRSN